MECDFCKTRPGKFWVHDNTKVLCEDCHGLFKVVKNSKFKEMVAFSKYESIEEPACEAKDFSGMQVINKFAGKTTKF